VNQLKALVPTSLTSSPFGHFQIVARVAGGGEECWAAREELQAVIDKHSYQVRGVNVQVTVEPGADRQRWYKLYFDNLRALESLVDSSLFEPDPKALAIYTKGDWVKIGGILLEQALA